ncbi:MAG: GAF domain-containing protein, partial [Chloroflexi bacterium]|nr:GAF domain-containing protein [Chloroflexota bacterium]
DSLLLADTGESVYHLLILLSLEAVVLMALMQWSTIRNLEHRQILAAYIVLALVRAVMLAAVWVPPLASVAPVISALEPASLALLVWATICLIQNEATRRLPLLVGLLVAILICTAVLLPGWDRALMNQPGLRYRVYWQQSFWYALCVVVALIPLPIALRQPRSGTRTRFAVAFTALSVGFLLLFVSSLMLVRGGRPDYNDGESALILVALGYASIIAGYLVLVVNAYCGVVHGMWELRAELQGMSEEALHHTQELSFLVETTQAIGSSLDLDTILHRVVEGAALALGADRGAVLLIDADSPHWAQVAAHYALLKQKNNIERPMVALVEHPPLDQAIESGQQLIINSRVEALPLEPIYTLLGSSRVGPVIVQPLRRQSRALGVLIVGNDYSQQTFGADQARLCQSIAVQAAAAIDNARLYRDLAAQTRQLAELLQAQKESGREQTAILESIAEGIIASDPDGRVKIANVAAEKILGVPRSRMLGLLLDRLMSQVSPRSDADWRSVAHSQMSLQTVLRLQNKIVYIHSAPVLTASGEYRGTVAVLRDITKETEAERAKSDFITVASHELRTPLTTIRGYAEALSSGMAGQVSDTQYHFLRIIRDSALRMANLTENLIAVSEIEKDFLRLDYEETDLHLLIGDVVVSFQSQLEDRQIEIRLDLDATLPMLIADRARIRQILDNLVSNAIKFTYPGGRITIGACALHEASDAGPSQCAISVADTGIGIMPEEQARIWERFYRPSNPLAEESGGLGMGLSIVRSLTEAHGGRVWVESRPGVGSTFTVLLPIRPTEHADG